MDAIRQVTRQLDAWWHYISGCVDAPVSTPACKSFWTWTTVVVVAIGLLILWKFLAWLLRPFLVWLEEMKLRAQDRKVADPDTMARYKVDDSKLHSGTTQENVEQKIRDALLEKKLTDQQQRHHQLMGDKKER